MLLSLDMKLNDNSKSVILFVAVFFLLAAIGITVSMIIREKNEIKNDPNTVEIKPKNVIDGSIGPSIVNAFPSNARVGDKFSFTPVIQDPDTTQDKINIRIKMGPAWMSLFEREITGVPTAYDVGSTSKVIIEVSDGVNNVDHIYYVVVTE